MSTLSFPDPAPLWASALVLLAAACTPGSGDPKEDASTSESSSAATETETETADTSADTTSGTSAGTSSDTSAETSSSDTAPACTKNVVLMGYWPPTNEMLRQWSPNPDQNPGGWTGENWRDHGFDVYAFFPEFPPDGDPTNDEIGDPGSVGSPDYDLQVDYQATSGDFWRIVDEYQPVLMITTSRGGGIGWEVEALEGGHGQNNPNGPALDWASDSYNADTHPTQASIEARSWALISTYRQGQTLPSALPIDAIVEATEALALTDVVIDSQTSGNYLSGFLGLHGVYYDSITDYSAAAGHIHVGGKVPVPDATALIEASLEATLLAHPASGLDCPPEG